jgi:chemotaxis protein methyltransferase CheR
MELTQRDFDLLRAYIHKICGIALGDDKQYLVRQRLEPIAVEHGTRDFAEFARTVSCCADGPLRDRIIAAITTNETSFFRDGHPFALFRATILPTLRRAITERKTRPVGRKGAKAAILSAGASTGQEPYTLSIIINESIRHHPDNRITPADFTITAADVSSRALAQAVSGEYTSHELQRGLTDLQKSLYFDHTGDTWTVKNRIKQLVDFRKVNFIEPFTHLGGFDVIFCRNMLIYFDQSTRSRILEQFHHMLADTGFLVLGATENIYGLYDRFEPVRADGSTAYRKK